MTSDRAQGRVSGGADYSRVPFRTRFTNSGNFIFFHVKSPSMFVALASFFCFSHMGLKFQERLRYAAGITEEHQKLISLLKQSFPTKNEIKETVVD